MQLAKPDEVPVNSMIATTGQTAAFRFVYYVTGAAFAAGLVITLVVLNARAAKRWRELRVPRAKALS
jgi:bacteriorhodopsin